MSGRERRKGLVGEREVAAIYTAAGWELRGLEGSGDWLAFAHGTTQHVEVKRQEVARPWLGQEQALAEAPAGTLPVVVFRRSRSEWWTMAPTAALLAAVEQAVAHGGAR
jgi:hypothetical protein